MFLLTTRNEHEIKSEEFEYSWKDYFVTGSRLKQEKQKFSYKNKNPEKDPIIWGFNSIWYGRATQQFKTLPQNILSDYEQVISQQTVKPATFLSP